MGVAAPTELGKPLGIKRGASPVRYIQPSDHRYPRNVYALTLERPGPATFRHE